MKRLLLILAFCLLEFQLCPATITNFRIGTAIFGRVEYLTPFKILLETGDALLLENGDKFLLE